MEQSELKSFILAALKFVKTEAPCLPLSEIGERSLVGRIATHLDRLVRKHDPTLNIDIEYNIDPNGDRKWLDADNELAKAAKAARRRVYDGDRIVVVPDIVIHQRGMNYGNLAVIEVKFDNSSPSDLEYARLKLRAFQNPSFSYQFAILLTLSRDWQFFTSDRSIQFIPKT